MLRIGLTGGIASGKSTAARTLKRLGARVIDADEAARRVVEPHSAGLNMVAARFGADMIKADGTLDRLRLGAVVFSDDGALRRLNEILHPLIREELERQAREAEQAEPNGVLVMDVPLLIECGWQDAADEVWLVTAPEGLRVRRIMARDGISEAAARRRIAAQMPDGEKRRHADRVLVNDGDVKKLESEVCALYGALTGGYGEEKEKKRDMAEDSGGVHGAVLDDGGGVPAQPRAGKAEI